MPRGDILVVGIVLAITAARYILIAQPLDLATEEAQYWLWAQNPDGGYFTKPPMVAWIIALTTGFFGDTVFGVKASAPLIQMVSALLMGHIAKQVAPDDITPSDIGERAGRLATLIWITLPAGNIAGFIISTDSPMILFLLAMLAALAPLARGNSITAIMALVGGIFFGLAMMSKYAAIYILIGLALWYLTDPNARRMVTPRHILIFATGALLAMYPNIVWNLDNGFASVTHLGDNANLDEGSFSALRAGRFWLEQVAIVGPVLFGCVVAAVVGAIREGRGAFWLWCGAPALTVITIQAFLSDANANWAAASWPPLLILTTIWLAGTKRIISRAAIICNLAIMVLAWIAAPMYLTPVWQTHSPRLTAFMAEHNAAAIITTRRGHTAPLIWEMRDTGFEVTIIDRDGIPHNHYEAEHRWQPRSGRRAVLVGNRLNADDFPELAFTDEHENSHAESGHAGAGRRYRHLDFHLVIEK